MYQRFYIEVRGPTGNLKEFYLYDNYGDVRRALRSLPELGHADSWRPTKDTLHKTVDERDRYLANQFPAVSSLLALSLAEIERMSKSVPLPIIEAAKGLEAQRLANGYLPGLLDSYWRRYRHLYLAAVVGVIASIAGAYFLGCRFPLIDSTEVSFIHGIGTLAIGAYVYRHFVSWAPVFWLSGLAALLLLFAITEGGHVYCELVID
ncbi:MAG: hypothetical protein ACT4SY_06505 [Hyphomicrobiales bacterium]